MIHASTVKFDKYKEQIVIKQFRVKALVTCEVCGREIVGKSLKAMIGEAKMVVCRDCAKLGSVYWEVKPRRQRSVRKTVKSLSKVSIRKAPAPTLSEDLELIENFGARIREVRREAGLSHEDLGRKIRERVSVLRKIETGKMAPDHLLAQKLEHALKVTLLVPPSKPKASRGFLSKPRGVTLGDIVNLKKGKAEETEKRKRS
ncbi:MAG: multiprotein bridging factor aMBF1 [Candidatus Bathyarchaeota archaeon]|nr:multiprotein bridging factor aMBF1 [Candidatus Bathyarchaeota archaeon]